MRLHLTVGATRQSTRGRNATIAAFVVLAAMVPAGAVVAADQTVDVTLPYTCTLPSGAVDATVRVSASLPDRVDVGQAIQASDVETSVELSEEAVHKLIDKEATTVTSKHPAHDRRGAGRLHRTSTLARLRDRTTCPVDRTVDAQHHRGRPHRHRTGRR